MSMSYQKRVLGSLLFSIYINDLVTVSNKLNFLMYAHDTTIFSKVIEK